MSLFTSQQHRSDNLYITAVYALMTIEQHIGEIIMHLSGSPVVAKNSSGMEDWIWIIML